MTPNALRWIVPALFVLVLTTAPLRANPKLAFWDRPQRKGANQFNKASRAEWYVAGRELGLQWVRMVPDKWKADERDFLIGDCDDLKAINESDFAQVKAALDDAHAQGHKVVFGMLSLPGCRWRQLNGGKDDYRLWQDEKYQQQAAALWRELVSRLKDHPAVVAYNPLNEPHPERVDGIDGDAPEKLAAWIGQNKGKPGDLDAFNRRIVAAIREVDRDTPILVEGYGHGNAAGLAALAPIDDPAILYSLHFYEPWNYTAKRANGGKYAYPDRMPQERPDRTVDEGPPARAPPARGRLGQASPHPADADRCRRIRVPARRRGRGAIPGRRRLPVERVRLALGVLRVPRGRVGWNGLRTRHGQASGVVLASRRARRGPGRAAEGQPAVGCH